MVGNDGIYRVPAAGGEMSEVTDGGSLPHFGASNERIYFTRGGDGASLVSVDLNGHEERTHITGEMITEYQVAPDGAHVAFRQNYDVFVMPLPPGPQSVSGGSNGSALPTVEVSGNGATYFHWSEGGTHLNWSMGPEFFSVPLADFRPDPARETEYTPPESGVSLAMTATADRPSGVTAIAGARIITMAGEDGGVIEAGNIIIEGNRIVAVGADVEVPEGARVVNANGMTITPGFIDAHAHGPQGTGDLVPEQNWSAIAHLALGVTTIHDPSSRASHIFTASEYQRTGTYLPRASIPPARSSTVPVRRRSMRRSIRSGMRASTSSAWHPRGPTRSRTTTSRGVTSASRSSLQPSRPGWKWSPRAVPTTTWTWPWWRTAIPRSNTICRSR